MPFIKRESHTISLKQIPSLNPPPGNRSNSIVSKKKTSASTSTSLQPVPQRRNVDYGYKVKEMLGNGIRTFKIFSNVFSSDEIGQLPRLRVIHWRSQAPESGGEAPAVPMYKLCFRERALCALRDGYYLGRQDFWCWSLWELLLDWTSLSLLASKQAGHANPIGRDLRRKRSPSPELPKKRPRLAITAAQSDIHSLNRSANSFKTYLSSIPLSDAEAIREGIKQLQNTRAELDKACDALQSRLSDLEKEEASGWSLYLK
ncbi:hypothetical protein PRK78_002778 [Emydomyces testavorans]|uniref:Uncharacterized protein n=1 Tax=Emydomyces testavorans TaxID=2070801 RepID=A0AAF0IHV3_9EURO|nr:hypothetical protein PRK78_002778 [Emydomyces testavorans]